MSSRTGKDYYKKQVNKLFCGQGNCRCAAGKVGETEASVSFKQQAIIRTVHSSSQICNSMIGYQRLNAV